eukprot:1324612-Prymnesium_polylepis.1
MGNSGNAGAVARLAAPVPWGLDCLDADCPIGSLAADAMRAWSAGDGQSDFLVALLPSHCLGAGLSAGEVGWPAIARVLPPDHTLYELRVPAHALLALLNASVIEARRACKQPAGGWQVSGVELELRCGEARGSSAWLRVASRRNGSLVVPSPAAPIGVVTLSPGVEKLAQLAAPLATPVALGASAQS